MVTSSSVVMVIVVIADRLIGKTNSASYLRSVIGLGKRRLRPAYFPWYRSIGKVGDRLIVACKRTVYGILFTFHSRPNNRHRPI